MAPLAHFLLAAAALQSTSAYCLPTFGFGRAATPVLPLSEASPGLPATTSAVQIIALGVGTQNYTCNPATGTFGTNVALADLYDITNRVQSNTKDSLTRLYLDASKSPLKNPLFLQHIGKHFFTTSPNFDFSESGKGYLQAKKTAGVPAPAGSDPGVMNQGYGAVDWIYLQDNGSGKSQKLGSVYRVETAGGKPPLSCKGSEQVFVPYSAEYWFYS